MKFLPHAVLFATLLSLLNVQAGAVWKDVELVITNDVGFGYEVCALGPHPLLGGGEPLRAVKLAWTPSNVWRGTVALPAGESLTYRFVKRNFNAGAWGDPGGDVDLSGTLTVRAPGHTPAPWTGKTIFLRTSWTQANILYRDRTLGGDWIETSMQPVASGRFRVDGVAAGGSEIEFAFNDGNGTWLNAPPPPSQSAQGAAPAVPVPYQDLAPPYNFRTRLDVFLVQNQEIFTQLPPPGGWSPPRIETRQIASTVSGIPGRQIAIYLPRGYDENTDRRYPVVYFHDGQNVFFPGGDFGTWDADRIATYEISQGRMREAILVAVDNDGINRVSEYLPDGESLSYGGQIYQGAASRYTQFLLDNVMPTLDVNFRTLTSAADTFTAGSSMGGLISDTIVFEQSDRFGAAGIFSPAYWAAPTYLENRAMTRSEVRRYLYMGTAESSTGESSSDIYWRGALEALDSYLRAGHPVNHELLFEGGEGALHNEPAWSRRLPTFFAFALDPWRAPNPLALEHFPPTLRAVSKANGIEFHWTGLIGFDAVIQSAASLDGPWTSTSAQSLPGVEAFWDEATHSLARPQAASHYWRLRIPEL